MPATGQRPIASRETAESPAGGEQQHVEQPHAVRRRSKQNLNAGQRCDVAVAAVLVAGDEVVGTELTGTPVITSRVRSARLNPYASSPLNIPTDSSSCIGVLTTNSAPMAARRAISAATSDDIERASLGGRAGRGRQASSTIAASATHHAVSGETVYSAPPAIPRRTARMGCMPCQYAITIAGWPRLIPPGPLCHRPSGPPLRHRLPAGPTRTRRCTCGCRSSARSV